MASVLAYHWPLHEPSGTTTFSSIKTSNDATSTGSGTLTAGQDGFGVISHQIEVSSEARKLSLATEINLAGEFAVSFWVTLNTNNDDDQHIIGKGATDFLSYDSTGTFWNLKVNNVAYTLDCDTLTTGTEHHVVVRRDGSNNVDLFVDNTLEDSISGVTGTFDINYILGTGDASGEGLISGGKLADMRIYTTGNLSTDNVEALYEMGVLPTPIKLSDLRKGLKRETIDADVVWYFDGTDDGTINDDDWTDWLAVGTADQTASFDETHTPYAGVSQHRRYDREFANETGFTDHKEDWYPAGSHDLTDGGGTAKANMRQGTIEYYLPPGSLVDRTDRDSIDYVGNSNSQPFRNATINLYYGNYSPIDSHQYLSVNKDVIEGYKSAPIMLGHQDFNTVTNIDAVTRIVMQADYNYGARKWMTYNKMEFADPPTKGRVHFRFDDGYEAHDDIAQAAETAGIVCSFAIITDEVGESNRLTRADLARMYAAGHALVNHCEGITGYQDGDSVGWVWPDSNRNEFTSLAARAAAVNACKSTLQSWGYPDYSRLVVVPGGHPNPGNKTSESDEQLVYQNHADALWYGGAGNPMWCGNPGRSERRGDQNWCMRGAFIMDKGGSSVATRLTEIEAELDRIADARGDAVFYAHDINEFPLASWNSVISHAQSLSSTLEIVGLDSFYTPISLGIPGKAGGNPGKSVGTAPGAMRLHEV